MSYEYIRVSKPEQVYSQKTLLLAQLGILTALKYYHSYKDLRKQELILKITLKKHVKDAQQSLALLEALLPKVPKKSLPEEKPFLEEDTKKLSLIQEIELIKEKLRNIS